MAVRGIRGATSAKANNKGEMVSATEELLKKIVSENGILPEDIASIVFSVTKDLNAEFPAVAARKLGLSFTPLLCTYEIDVPDSLKQCIRILMHVNSDKKQSEIKNIYLRGTECLRPDFNRKGASG